VFSGFLLARTGTTKHTNHTKRHENAAESKVPPERNNY
jgi:hypothetical protein